MSQELLKPTRIYVKPVLDLLRVTSYELRVTGIAHITGGAFYDKIARILPKDVNVCIYKDSWVVPQIFRLIQRKGSIADKEMYHTFNMGVGMVLIAEHSASQKIIARLAGMKQKAWIIGEVITGNKKVIIV